MKFGLLLPNRGKPYGDVHLLLDLALLAEVSGWDGWFIWDHIGGGGDSPCIDPWICLAGIASRTRTMRLGTLITPLARRRPWKVAREITTLDHLSHGRAVLGVGLGDRVNKDFGAFGEVTHPVTRAEMLDEALDIVTGLQSGKPFNYNGKHYHVSNALFHPAPVQSPRVPVWVAGCWPHKPPFRRAARWDGVVPIGAGVEPFPPKKIREMVDYIQKYRNSDSPFDVCLLGRTAGKDLKADRATVKSYVPAGLTWYLEAIHSGRGSINQVRERIKIGPPH